MDGRLGHVLSPIARDPSAAGESMTRVRCLVAAAAAAFALLAAGCFSFTPSKRPGPRVGSQTAELPWPAPDVTPLEAVRDSTPERVFRGKFMEGRGEGDVKNANMLDLVNKAKFTVIRNEIIDGSLVRMIKDEDGLISWTALLMGFVPNGYVLSTRDVSPPRKKLVMARAERRRQTINAIWAKDGIEVDDTDDRVDIDGGIAIRVPESVPDNCRGVVVHLWALARNDYEIRVMEELASRGWYVIDVKPGIGAPAELREAAVDRILELEVEQSKVSAEMPKIEKGESSTTYQKRLHTSAAYLRFVEINKAIGEARNPAIPLCTSDDVPAAAVELGSRIDGVLADNARGASAALETARRIHPSLRAMRVVVVGFSAGAISTPTVAALIKPDAVVIIGGAANGVGIATRSELTRGGVRLMCDGKPPRVDLVRELENAYLAASKLDPFHAAPLLQETPVLVIDAGMDTWVPSEFGEVLYERLGKPDRLHMALGGHGMLFYFLPGRAKWIAGWMEKAVAAPKAGVNTR